MKPAVYNCSHSIHVDGSRYYMSGNTKTRAKVEASSEYHCDLEMEYLGIVQKVQRRCIKATSCKGGTGGGSSEANFLFVN